MQQATAHSAKVTTTIHDTPPMGVTVLSFEVQITGAVLQPGNQTLESEPREVEITQLETESAVLSTEDVQPGSYTSVDLTFGQVEMTVQNSSINAIGNCQSMQVCRLQLPANPAMVTFSFPSPLVLAADQEAGLQIDLNLNSIVQPDLSLNFAASNAVTVTELSPGEDGELDEMRDIFGAVQSVGTNQFTLQTALGTPLTINVDSNTQFNFSQGNCPANNFSCVAMGQILHVDAVLMAGGTLLAKQVELLALPQNLEFHGEITKVDSSTQFEVVINFGLGEMEGMSMGVPVTIAIQTGATFNIDSNGFTIPSNLTFMDSGALLVGQEVGIHPVSVAAGATPGTFVVTVDRITLRGTQLTGTVAQVNSMNGSFTLNGLPGLFTTAGITQIQVITTSQTTFGEENSGTVASVTAGQTVSVEGFLFNTGSSPTLVAERVFIRQTMGGD